MGKINFINDVKNGTQFYVDFPEELECGDEICAWFDNTETLMKNILSQFNGKVILEENDENDSRSFYETPNAKYAIVSNHDCNFAISVSPINDNISKYAIFREIVTLIAALQKENIVVSKWTDDFGTKELAPISELNEKDLDDIFYNSALQTKLEELKKKNIA